MTNRMRFRLILAVALALPVVSVMFGQTRSGSGFAVPDFADLTITTRASFGAERSSTTTTLYLKGSRERLESVFAPLLDNAGTRHASIQQCDQRRSIHLNLDARIYAVAKFVDLSSGIDREAPLQEPQGPVVTTTVDAVDTGERRQVGRQVARRVRTTVVVSPSAGANTPASRREIDGWYVDLPGRGCLDREAVATMLADVNPNGPRDRHRYEAKGTARRGYAIEQTSRYTEARATLVETIALVEWSGQPLDASLFDIPTDFRPALPILGGGFDLTKADTVANRLQAYWDALTMLISRAVPW